MLIDFLEATAITMAVPALYGPFHIICFIAGTCAALLLARLLSRHIHNKKSFDCILFISGCILIIGEIYKQLMYYFVLYNHSYYWWIFPFQLCTIPMYICLLLPLLQKNFCAKDLCNQGDRSKGSHLHSMACTFMLDFNLMGALLTFVDPSGLFQPYLTLTLHGVLWHLILIFIGFFIFFCNMADLTTGGFLRTLPIFVISCAIAQIFNALFHDKGSINLFYISPFETSNQLIFSDIDALLGRPIGIVIYMLAMVLGAWIVHRISTALAMYKSG